MHMYVYDTEMPVIRNACRGQRGKERRVSLSVRKRKGEKGRERERKVEKGRER